MPRQAITPLHRKEGTNDLIEKVNIEGLAFDECLDPSVFWDLFNCRTSSPYLFIENQSVMIIGFSLV